MLRNNRGLYYSVIDLQLYNGDLQVCRFAKGYSHNVLHCAYPLCTVSHNSKTLQVCVSLRCIYLEEQLILLNPKDEYERCP